MTFNWALYRSATGCTRYGPAGPQAFLLYVTDRFDFAYSLGICNCRPVFGGGSWSHHAECRANDIGIPTNPDGSAKAELGMQVIDLIGPHGDDLGFDHSIYNREIWSRRTPDGRYYTGRHPHKNHIHNGQTRNAAANLTYGTLVAVLGPTGLQEEFDMLGFDIGLMGQPSVKGEMAGALQAMLVDRGFDLGVFGPNGDGVDKSAGDITRKALHDWKISEGIAGTLSAGEGKIGVYEYARLHPHYEDAGDTFDHAILATTAELGAQAALSQEALDAHAGLTHDAHHE